MRNEHQSQVARRRRWLPVAGAVWLALGLTPVRGATPAELSQALRDSKPGTVEQARLLRELQAYATGPMGDPDTTAATREIALFRLESPETAPPRRRIIEWLAYSATSPQEAADAGVLLALAEAQEEIGDNYGSFLSYQRHHTAREGFEDLGLKARAAEMATQALEMATAQQWSEEALELAPQDTELLSLLHRARLKAAESLGKLDEALESARAIQEIDPESLHADSDALQSAMRLFDALERIEDFVENASIFVNVYPNHPDHAEALWRLSERYAQQGKRLLQDRMLDWLVVTHADSVYAARARLLKLGDRGRPPHPNDIPDYMIAIRETDDSDMMQFTCREMFNNLLRSGFPVEAWMAVVTMVRTNDLGGVACAYIAGDLIGESLQLLIARQDTMGVAAVALAAQSIEVPIPSFIEPAVRREMQSLGIQLTQDFDKFDSALTHSREAYLLGECGDQIHLLELALRDIPRLRGVPHDSIAEAAVLWVHCKWDELEIEELTTYLDGIAAQLGAPVAQRRLWVAKAGLLFADDRETACSLYVQADAVEPSRWVDAQLKRCAAATPPAQGEVKDEPNGSG